MKLCKGGQVMNATHSRPARILYLGIVCVMLIALTLVSVPTISTANAEIGVSPVIKKATDALSKLELQITALPGSAFRNSNNRETLLNKIAAVFNQVDSGAYKGAANKITDDIKDKITKWIIASEQAPLLESANIAIGNLISASIPVISEYIQLPTIAQVPDTPSQLNRVAFLRTYNKDARGMADAVILFQDGSTAGPWSVLAKQLVDMAARRGKRIEVWSVDRRENNLEDHRGFSEAIRAGDPKVALKYYYGDDALDAKGKFNSAAQLGGPGATYIPLQQGDVPFMANWGVDVIFDDMETLLRLIPEQYRKTNVFLMGNFTGAYLLTSFAGHRLRDGKRAYEELAGLIMMEGTPNPAVALEPTAADIASYLANVQGLRSGTVRRYSGDPRTGVDRDIRAMFGNLFPRDETIYAVPAGASGGPLADQFVANLRLTNHARSGFSSGDEPIAGAFLQSPALAFLTLRAGRLDFTPAPGTEGACAAPGPFGLVPPCVPPISQIDPNRVYDWLDGGAGGPGAAGDPLDGWTVIGGNFTDIYVIPGEKPSSFTDSFASTYTNTTYRTNVQPISVNFPASGNINIYAFPSDSYAWYVNNRFQAIDMNFIGKFQKVLIQRDDLNVHIDIDKAAVTGIPLISYVSGYQTAPVINPFGGVDDFTNVTRYGATGTSKAMAVGTVDPRVTTKLYKNGDFYYADNSLAGQVVPGENGANVVAASYMDWLIPRMGNFSFEVPEFGDVFDFEF